MLILTETNELAIRSDLKLTPKLCWNEGVNIRYAMRKRPAQTMAFLVAALGNLVEFIDAKKTIKGNEQLMFTMESLIEEFPTMKVEEFILVFRMIATGKFGKMYERLKLPELYAACVDYESEHRAEIMEAQKHDDGFRYDPSKITYKPTRLSDGVREVLTFEQKQDYGRRRMAEDAIDTPDSASPENCEHEPTTKSED